MPPAHDDLPPAASAPAPTAADFDRAFSAAASPGLRRIWDLAEPTLPSQIEPFSFVSADLLHHVARALDLAPGQTLADLGCGRGGPGLWLARETGAFLVALGLGNPGDDALLAGLQAEARQRLPLADLQHRVVVIATAPDR